MARRIYAVLLCLALILTGTETAFAAELTNDSIRKKKNTPYLSLLKHGKILIIIWFLLQNEDFDGMILSP